MHKKTALAIGLLLAVSPVIASADQLSDLIAQVNALMAQLKTLQTSVPSTATIPTTSSMGLSGETCVSLTQNMGPDDTDADASGEVTKLQKWLSTQGVYPEARITGYFGPATMRAVQRWQAKHNIVASGDPDSTGYGYIGPKTRTAMNGCAGSTGTTHTQPNSNTSSLVVDVDGNVLLNIAYKNLPLSTIVLVDAASGQQFDVDDNVSGSGGASVNEHNMRGGYYYLKAIAHDNAAREVARSNTFSINLDASVTSRGDVPTINNFSANPTSVVAGQSTTLSWSSNGTNCSIWGVDGSNLKSGAGSASTYTVYPGQTTTYNLRCYSSAALTTQNYMTYATRPVTVSVIPAITAPSITGVSGGLMASLRLPTVMHAPANNFLATITTDNGLGAALIISNTSSVPLTVTHPTGCPVSYQILGPTGDTVDDSTWRTCNDGLYSITVQPNESVQFPIEVVDSNRFPTIAGTYTVVAALTGNGTNGTVTTSGRFTIAN
ncbi:MAG: hypothetical protein RLZZ416_690 [Candidatus Parcubacteria bacterium]